MSRGQFVDEDFDVPTHVDSPAFHLRVLDAGIADLDYEAVVANRSCLRGTFAGTWPDNVTCRADNLRDIQEHVDDFIQRKGFTYSILTVAETRCLGCVYIYPSAKRGFDAAVYYWLLGELVASPWQWQFVEFLAKWLRERWPFSHIAYPGRGIPWKDWHSLPDACCCPEAVASVQQKR